MAKVLQCSPDQANGNYDVVLDDGSLKKSDTPVAIGAEWGDETIGGAPSPSYNSLTKAKLIEMLNDRDATITELRATNTTLWAQLNVATEATKSAGDVAVGLVHPAKIEDLPGIDRLPTHEPLADFDRGPLTVVT